jgi:ABC-type branched-subunit amino acid transport system substrate-binding protein
LTFCQIGAQLWGEGHLTWRSATAFDAGLVILRTLEMNLNQTGQTLLANINRYFKEQKN